MYKILFSPAGIKPSAMNRTEITSGNNGALAIPMPIQVVIDDVGWWSGMDGSPQQEPYRTGINRDHTIADYKAIIELGSALGMRPQAAMVLCEWDRQNILRELPDSTWMGTRWDNDKWVGPMLDEAADLFRNNQDHIEFTLHGIGHEYWTGGKLSRAEWAGGDGTMRPVEHVEKHLDYYEKLMQQNALGSLPSSFVPTAFIHGFGRTGEHTQSLAELLNKRGITYINTPFYRMQNADKVVNGVFGLDAGVLTVDRGNDLLKWNTIGKLPEGELAGPTCGMHWPNLLHEDPDRSSEIVQGWVKFLKPYNNRIDTLLAKNSLHFQKQLIHCVGTGIKLKGDMIELDFRETDGLNLDKITDELTVKFQSPDKKRFDSDSLYIVSSREAMDRAGFFYTLQLRRKKSQDISIIRISSNA